MRSGSFLPLTDNPLMLIRVRSFSGGQYENQRAFTDKLALGTALVMMASVLTDPREGTRAAVMSSARMNNFETRDINHYLVFENAGRRRRLQIRRVPMNLSPQVLAQLSDLAVDLDPESWATPRVTPQIDQLSRAFASFEPFHARHGWQREGARGRVARKLFDSIFWFRRSFNSVADVREAVVALAVAFETVLTDSYGSTDVFHAKVERALSDAPRAAELGEEVRHLFRARGQAVHLGGITEGPDLRLARRAYVRCFIHVAERLHAAPRESSAPIAVILAAPPF